MKYLLMIILTVSILYCCTKRKDTINSADKNTLRIAYNIHIPDTTEDDWEIVRMNVDGSDKKNITNHEDVAWTYYAYKNRLFFISDRDTSYRYFFLYECDADGNNIKKVSNLRLEDSWMSSRNNGDEMIVSGRIGKEVRYQLFIINTRSGDYQQITNDTSARYSDPCFSPDGKQIVLSYKAKRKDRNTHEELYLMQIDNGKLTQLTHYPEDNPSAKEYGYRAGAARWHPTENFISYVSKQDGRHSIYAITPDGKKQWKLIENPESEGWHDWSTDGRWLVYNNSDNSELQYHITLMDWTTKEKKQLTDSTYKSQLAPVFIEQ